MAIYVRLGDIERQKFLVDERLSSFLASGRQDLREKATEEEDRILGAAAGMGELFELPYVKSRIKEEISLEKPQPDWFITKPQEMGLNLETATRGWQGRPGIILLTGYGKWRKDCILNMLKNKS